MKIICDYCGKEFKKKPSEIGKHNFCCRECYKKALKDNIKLNPNYKENNSKKCDYCGKDIRVTKSKQKRNEHNFCSKECFGKWESENLIGDNASNYKNALINKRCPICNKEFSTYFNSQIYCSVECKSKTQTSRKTLICSNCEKEFERTASQIFWANQRGYEHIFCSKKCQFEYHKGKNHPHWFKDRTQLKEPNKSLRWSKEMKDWRKAVYKRDNYTCQMCGNRSSKDNAVILNAHHIERFVDNENLRFDINNGITLCEDCHKLTYWKEKEFEKQFKDIIKYVCKPQKR